MDISILNERLKNPTFQMLNIGTIFKAVDDKCIYVKMGPHCTYVFKNGCLMWHMSSTLDSWPIDKILKVIDMSLEDIK